MRSLFEAWDGVENKSDLPPVPPLSSFEACYEEIDVGYDCFISDCYVYGPYALLYDREEFRRDTWGWSAHVSYRDDRGVWTYDEPAYKCDRVEQAYDALVDYYENLNL